MQFFVAIVAFPALLLLLALGTGLLIERLAGWRVPGPLLPPLGVAGLVVVSQLMTGLSATAPLAPIAVAVCAVAGLAAGVSRLRLMPREVRAEPLPLLAGLAVYGVACAPVILSGRVTLSGYLLDTTAAIQLAGADRLLSHGLDFSALANSGYKDSLVAYFGTHYPSGAHTVLGSIGRLLGASLIWLYQPFLASMLALCAPSLWLLGRRLSMPRLLAALTAVVASVPALVYAYELMGAIKEITLLPFVLLLGALLVSQRLWLGISARAALPVVVTGAAGVSTIGLAFGPWLALALLIAVGILAVHVRERLLTPGHFGMQLAVVAGLFVVAAFPTVANLSSSVSLAGSLSQGNQAAASDPGNLLQPLHAVQTLGVWLHGDHRIDPPRRITETYALIGVALTAVILGVGWVMRRRAWVLATFLTGSGLIWWELTRRGTVWTDAKLLVLVSPLALLLAFAGVQAVAASGRRLEALALAALITFGVAWSDADLYHDTNLAPTQRFNELERIGGRFAGQGPTLVTDFDEFTLYLLRDLDVDAPGFARKPASLAQLADGSPTGYGHSYDVDALPLNAVRAYRLVVVRRSPELSEPPSGFARVFTGTFYEVWRRSPQAGLVIAHDGQQGDGGASATPRCRDVQQLAGMARRDHARLRYVLRPKSIVVDPVKAARSPRWPDAAGGGVALFGTGRLDTTVQVRRPGRYRLWLEGDISRPVEALVDGRRVGSMGYQSGGEGNYLRPVDIELARGARKLALHRGGGTLRPGDAAPSRLLRIVLEPVGTAHVVTVAPSAWRALCGRPVDWLEVVR